MGDDNFEDSESLLDSPRVTKTRKPSLDKTKPVQIIVRDPNDFHKFRLNEEALEAILTTDEQKSHQPICVLSVAGAFRKGKSFLINLFMNYLKNETLTDEIEMLFTWRGGATRDTTGILAWPELFTIKRHGQEMSLLILDTQGTFDEESTVRDNATIFALSCMTSSKIIYNISQQIQEDDLQHLELFTNYGELALESGQAKPFQSLTFLVRDWQVPYEFLYGRDKASEADPEYEITASGNEYLRKKLIVKEGQHEDLANVREHVRDCFEKTECFLLPHPGLAVASNPKFHGQTKMIEKVFLEQTKSMFEKIYAEIQPKKVDGQVITSSQLLHFFKMYAKIFDEEDLPEPKSMLLATAEATLLSLHSDFSRQFDDEMKKKMAENGRAFSSSEFQQLSETQKGIVLTKFDTIKKLGTEDLISRFRNQLEDSINTSSDRFKEQNNTKRLATCWRTPATFVTINFICQILSSLFYLLWLSPIGWVFSTITWCGWLITAAWSYCVYSESMEILRERLDEIADFLALKVLCMGMEYVRGNSGSIQQVIDNVKNQASQLTSQNSVSSQKKED